jgi:hypothetical protein
MYRTSNQFASLAKCAIVCALVIFILKVLTTYHEEQRHVRERDRWRTHRARQHWAMGQGHGRRHRPVAFSKTNKKHIPANPLIIQAPQVRS